MRPVAWRRVLSEADRHALLDLARAAIVSRARGGARPQVRPEGTLGAQTGAFVTLRRGEELRGCIGYLERDRPLAEVVADCAVAAASEDPRFAPVTLSEVPGLTLEVSVLGPLEPIVPPEPAAVEVGRHGLVVQLGRRRGLLLPQVAPEWGWDAEAFLSHTCSKAGLPPDAWRHGAEVFRFEAEVFSEARGQDPAARSS
ncbi:MAG: AmmeMemoRadiSam system protein A [Acidobacteria bacterium]|nr:AmmeMemoRadiSam system protein A [Acidobacteriota bacterium]